MPGDAYVGLRYQKPRSDQYSVDVSFHQYVHRETSKIKNDTMCLHIRNKAPCIF